MGPKFNLLCVPYFLSAPNLDKTLKKSQPMAVLIMLFLLGLLFTHVHLYLTILVMPL